MSKKFISLCCTILVLGSVQIACTIPGITGTTEIDPASDSSASQPLEIGETESEETGQGAQVADEAQNPNQGESGSCLNQFVANSNITNGQIFEPEAHFDVEWTLENTGDCSWQSGYSFKQLGGEISVTAAVLSIGTVVAPGETVMLAVEMQAPDHAGTYISAWKMVADNDQVFGQSSPPNSPARVAIKVIPGGGGNQPNPTTEPPEAFTGDIAATGSDLTLLDGHCLDLNSGQEVACTDATADFQYQFSALFGAKIQGQHNTTISNMLNGEPDKPACEGASFATMPISVLEGKFYCFEIKALVQTVYSQIRVVRYDENGITFDFTTFIPDAPEIAVINPNLSVLSQGEQETMLADQCFDLQTGALNPACSGAFAGFLYEQVTKKGLVVMHLKPDEMQFSGPRAAAPSKSDCQSAAYNQAAIWPIETGQYYCYQFNPGTTTYYGWLRPTQFNPAGLTFDFVTWEALP